MIVKEFEGKSEKEAIDRAIEELGLDRDDIDFEIVEAKRPGILFRGGKVKIRVHLAEAAEEALQDDRDEDRGPRPRPRRRGDDAPRDRGDHGDHGDDGPRTRSRGETLEPQGEFEVKVLAFARELLQRMGFEADVRINFREEGRLGIDIESDGSGILIGKQGKTLEALQFVVNLAAGRMEAEPTRVILDTQDYRARRERALVRMGNQAAEHVRRSRGSQLLEPLNPFERRLIHTSLARYGDIETISEGDGLYKRIRVIWRGGERDRD